MKGKREGGGETHIGRSNIIQFLGMSGAPFKSLGLYPLVMSI